MTLSIPKDVHEEMKQFSEVRWSEVARKAIVDKLETLKAIAKVEKIAQKSKLTQKDVDEIGKKIKQSANKRFLDEYNHRL